MSRAGLARHAKKRDSNEHEIMAMLKARGFQTEQINGKGVFDLLCNAPSGRTFLVECKVPGGVLTEAQIKFRDMWRGEVYVIYHAFEVEHIPL